MPNTNRVMEVVCKCQKLRNTTKDAIIPET
jgi:hypothetical protein